jgi:hypothetical protein
MTTHTVGLAIGFPAAILNVAGTRWLIDGASAFIADARLAPIAPLTSRLPRPGLWRPSDGTGTRFRSVGALGADVAAPFETIFHAAAQQPGVPASVLGDVDDVIMPGDFNTVDRSQFAHVKPWDVVDDTGAVLGEVDGNKYLTLTGHDRLTFRWWADWPFHETAQRSVLIGYWDRAPYGRPAVLLGAIHPADDTAG